MAQTAQPTVSAELSVRRGREAVEFYKAAFGAVELYRVGDDQIVAQLSVDGAEFWVADESPAHFNFSQCEAGCFIRSLFEEDQMLQCRAVREYRANLQKFFLILNHQRAGAGIF